MAFLAFVPLAFGGMHKLWEIHIDIKEPARWPQDPYHAIGAIAFSPDNKRLAVTVDWHRGPDRTHLLILDLASPKTGLRQFDLDTCETPVRWSLLGDAVAVCKLVVRFKDGGICRPAGQFVDPEHYLTVEKREFVLRDFACRATDSWSAYGEYGEWHLLDTEPNSGLALLQFDRDRPGAALRILQASQHKPIVGWTWMSLEGIAPYDYQQTRFADGGRAVCAVTGGIAHRGVDCRDVADGKAIPSLSGLASSKLDAALVTAARDSPLIVVERWFEFPMMIMDSSIPMFVRRSVWDIRSGLEVASWRAPSQRFEKYSSLSGLNPGAISPDGKFIAEGANGVVRLYRLD